jgi:hypothetical protein
MRRPSSLTWRAGLAVLGLLAGGAAGAVAQTPAARPARAPAGPAVRFDTFQVIGNLNIFNASRVGYVPGGSQPHADTISFVGTMESAKGRLAFFDSSDRGFRKAVAQGDTIAGFTVTRIDTDRVVLTREAKPLTLGMSQQLRRPPGGDWEPGPAGSFQSAGPEGPAAPPAIPADASDVLRRLMEKRQQQMKQ